MRLILILLLTLTLTQAKKIALVIGNSDYQQGWLANPTKDADLIAQNLRDVGFTVTVKKDLTTKDKMEKAIDDFAGIVKDDDIAVIYYAGHGVQCKGKNYLIPTKATINRGGQLMSKALNLDVVIGAVTDIKLAIIMVDACRNNTYPSCSKSQTRGLAQTEANSDGGMIISFATAPNTEASDGDEHSPYALALSKFMNKSIPIETYFTEVARYVWKKTKDTKNPQKPMVKSTPYDAFSFGNGTPPTPTPTPKPHRDTSSKWITPTDSVCKANGGKIRDFGCLVKLRNAEKICSIMDAILPTINELKKVVKDCGGRLTKDYALDADKNSKNNNYQSCYKKNGFNSTSYFSSSFYEGYENLVWIVSFDYGYYGSYGKDNEHYVRCVRAGQ